MPTLFIHSAVGEHLGYFYFLADVNNAALNMGVERCVGVSDFTSWFSRRSGMAGGNGNSLYG